MAAQIEIREGACADTALVLSWFDEAVRWLVARGQAGQWGSEPFSDRADAVQRVRGLAASGGLRIAEIDSEPVGALVLGSAPAHVTPAERAELYIVLLLTSRRHAGRQIGAALVRRAVQEARAAGCEILRVDCWAGAPSLVRWYESRGFERTQTFDHNGWIGQVFWMPV